MKQTVAAYIAKTLESAGVKRIWGVTGDSLNGLSDSLNRMGTIEWMSTRHEEVAAFAAGAEAQQRRTGGLRRIVRPRQPALNQRPVRLPPQSRSGTGDCRSYSLQRNWQRLFPGNPPTRAIPRM